MAENETKALEILRRELTGNTVSLYELDEIMERIGCPSELEWINDECAWDDILKDKNIFYKVPDSDDHFAISFEIESEPNLDEENASCALINVVSVEIQ